MQIYILCFPITCMFFHRDVEKKTFLFRKSWNMWQNFFCTSDYSSKFNKRTPVHMLVLDSISCFIPLLAIKLYHPKYGPINFQRNNKFPTKFPNIYCKNFQLRFSALVHCCETSKKWNVSESVLYVGSKNEKFKAFFCKVMVSQQCKKF